jgi:hypothetical protein
MALFAHLRDGVVTDLLNDADGPLDHRFHPDFVAACVPVPAGVTVQVGWVRGAAGFAPAVAPAAPAFWYVPVPLLRQRLEAAGKWVAAATVIVTKPAMMLKLVTLQQGVANDDAEAIALLNGIGADPAVMLARPGT